MLEKINLFPKIEAIWEKRVKRQRLAQVVSVVVLILYFVLLSSLLSYSLLLGSQANSLNEKIRSYEKRVQRLEGVESKQVLLKSKLKELVKILAARTEPKEVLVDLDNLTLAGINFAGVDYLGDQIKINGEARDVLVLDGLVKNLEDAGGELFSQIEFESITRMTEGNYAFNLLLLR